MKTLVLGGIRSGKSRLAEQLASASCKEVTCIATARALDSGMQRRIDQHRLQRPDHWHVIEEPLHIDAVIREYGTNNDCLLIDCLTLWLGNQLCENNDGSNIQETCTALCDAVSASGSDIILVSSETGLGVMPDNALARHFCDHAGLLHQSLASLCDRVILTVAGLPHILKGEI